MTTNLAADVGTRPAAMRASRGQRRNSLRVAAVIDTKILSGPGRQLAALAAELPASGVDVLVVTYRRTGTAQSPFVAHLSDKRIPHVVIPESGPLDIRAVRRLAVTLRDFEPDVVQTHSYKATAHAWLLRRLGARWRWVGFSHGTTTEDTKARLYHQLDRRLIGAADQVVVVSAAQLDRFEGVSPRPRVIDNAVVPFSDAGAANPSPVRPAGGSEPRLGVVGRLSSEKGVDVFLDACALLRDRGLAFTAVVAGDGSERIALEVRCAALGLAHRIEFLGQVSDLGSLYKSLDLLVIPSRSEGLPNVLLEALAAGLPVAATRVGAIPHVLADPLAGTLAEPGSPGRLAAAIESSLALRTRPEAVLARRRVVDRYSLGRRVQEHLDLYRSVVPAGTGVVA